MNVAAVRERFTALQNGFAFFDAPGGTQVPDEVGQAIANALRDHANALGDQPHTVRHLRERQREPAVEQLRRLLPDARDQCTAAGAVDERRLVLDACR